jgi:hypothetical protein
VWVAAAGRGSKPERDRFVTTRHFAADPATYLASRNFAREGFPMLRKALLLPLLLTALASPAAATLLEVTITGTIAGGGDQDGSVFGLGPNGNPAGLPITIVFLIDTAKAPADSSPASTFGNYDSQIYNGNTDPSRNFIQATWLINGIARTSFQPNRDQIDQVIINDGVQPGGTDDYRIRDGSYDGTLTTNDRLFYVTITAFVSSTNLFTGDVLEQPLGSLNAQGTSQSCGQCAGFWEDHTNGKSERASWYLSQTGLAISYRVVPEPSFALLLGASALAFALRPKC